VCGTAAPAQITRGTAVEASIRDESGKPIEDAVVSLTGDSTAAPAPKATHPAVMDQVNKTFVPHVLPVVVGTAVRFPNRDNIKHHVYSFSDAKKFELPLYTGTPTAPVVFDKPGAVALGCNIHDWMVGHIYVLPTRYFAKTGADGVARIADVPSGAWEARVWHPRLRVGTETTGQRVSVSAGDPSRLAWTLSLRPERQAPAPGPGRYDPQQQS
jgi:plastocyanin